MTFTFQRRTILASLSGWLLGAGFGVLGLQTPDPAGAQPAADRDGGLVVATLHPLLTDVARQIGGEHVTVIGLMQPGQDPHDFRPTSADMTRLRSAHVVLVSGKGMELYLDDLRDNLRPGQILIEAGRDVPSLLIDARDELFVCCPAHSVGALDPHWWHSVRGMRRAVRSIGRAFEEADPARAGVYRQRADAYSGHLNQLHRWVQSELRRVPRNQRILATAHAAFNYLCRDYGFRALPVQGLNREAEVSSAYLQEAVGQIRDQRVPVIFREHLSHPRGIEAIVRATGVRVGGELVADGSARGIETYEQMVRHNVRTILRGFGIEE